MDPITAAIAAAPLFIEWAKERRQHGQDLGADAFQEWLSAIAFPQLLEASQTTVKLLSISQKAHHTELLGYLSAQFDEIKAKLEQIRLSEAGDTALMDRWRQLGPAAHELLGKLVEQVGSGDCTYEHAQLVGPFSLPDTSDSDVLVARERAQEADLLRYRESSSNGQWLRLTRLGYLATIAATVGQDAFESELERLRNVLAKAPSGSIDKLVASTHGRCSPAFVYAVLEQWDAVGWITLQILDQRERSRFMGTAQALFDADPGAIRRKTLHPFLG